jgi:hypothetical protein
MFLPSCDFMVRSYGELKHCSTIPGLGTGWERVFNFTSGRLTRGKSPQHWVDMKVTGSQRRSGFCVEEISCPVGRLSVFITTGSALEDSGIGVQVQVESRIISSPYRQYRLRDPPSHLYSRYLGSFLGFKAAWAWTWLVTSKKRGSIHLLPHASLLHSA